MIPSGAVLFRIAMAGLRRMSPQRCAGSVRRLCQRNVHARHEAHKSNSDYLTFAWAHGFDHLLDASHPPTRYRIEFLNAHVVAKPKMVTTEDTMRTIDAELKAVQEGLGQRLIARYARD